MGRSNAAGQQASFAPIDQYRKQLGRQAHKVEKKVHKEVNRRIANKVDRTTGAKTGGLLVALLCLLLTIAYLIVYVGLKYEDNRLEAVVRAFNAFAAQIDPLIAVGSVIIVIVIGFVAYKFRS